MGVRWEIKACPEFECKKKANAKFKYEVRFIKENEQMRAISMAKKNGVMCTSSGKK